MSAKNKGILCILSAAFFFALMGLFVKLSGDIPVFEKSFFRNLVAAGFSFLIMKQQKVSFRIPDGCGKYLLLRSISGTIGIFSNFYAVSHMMLPDASLLSKLSPFFAILFSCFLLNEKIRPYQLLCVMAAFIGAIFILKPGASSMVSFPALIGVLGGLTAGLAYTYVRIAGQHGAPGPLIVFFFSCFSCLCSVPLILIHPQPLSMYQLIMLIMAGFSAAGGQFSITAAYTFAPAREISVYDYTQIIHAAILGFIFFHDVPDGWSFLGYAIVCGSGILLYIIRMKRGE